MSVSLGTSMSEAKMWPGLALGWKLWRRSCDILGEKSTFYNEGTETQIYSGDFSSSHSSSVAKIWSHAADCAVPISSTWSHTWDKSMSLDLATEDGKARLPQPPCVLHNHWCLLPVGASSCWRPASINYHLPGEGHGDPQLLSLLLSWPLSLCAPVHTFPFYQNVHPLEW